MGTRLNIDRLIFCVTEISNHPFSVALLFATFGLHELILYVFEGILSELFCIHILGMEASDLHELI